MVLNKKEEGIVLNDVLYFIGQEVFGTEESCYAGLKGVITEIRTDKDMDTDNVGPDLYCAFEMPETDWDIKSFVERFSKLYGRQVNVEDIPMNCVIMAPTMIASTEKYIISTLLAVVENAVARVGYKLLDECSGSVMVRDAKHDMDFEIRIERSHC